MIAGIVCLIWFIRNNDPQNVAKAALSAIQSNDEDKAIELIQKGANLDYMHLIERGGGQLFPFLPFTWYPPLQMSLLEATAFHSRLKVCSYLINLGIDFTYTRALNMTDNYEIVKYLVEAGVPVNMKTSLFPFGIPFGWEPLDGCFSNLSEFSIKDNKIKLLNSLRIANYLIKQGAKISEYQDCPEVKKIERILVEKIKSIPIGKEEEYVDEIRLIAIDLNACKLKF